MTRGARSEPMQATVRPARSADEPAVLALLRPEGLEAHFVVSEFQVAEDAGAGRVVACGRLKRLPDGGLELASVAVAPDRRGQGAGDAVVRALLGQADGPVHALALAPGFFARHGFAPIAVERLPASLQAKATGMCASSGFVAMAREKGEKGRAGA